MHSTLAQLQMTYYVSRSHVQQPRTAQCNAKVFDQGGWVLAAAVQACASSSAICVSSALDFSLADLQAKRAFSTYLHAE